MSLEDKKAENGKGEKGAVLGMPGRSQGRELDLCIHLQGERKSTDALSILFVTRRVVI